MKKQISEVKVGDKILGTDGKWYHVVDKTEAKLPYVMYEIEFSNGKIKCSDTHLWTVYINDKPFLTDAMGLETNFDIYKDKHIGTEDGPTLIGIKRIEKENVQCLITDSPDHQFLIYTNMDGDGNEYFEK